MEWNNGILCPQTIVFHICFSEPSLDMLTYGHTYRDWAYMHTTEVTATFCIAYNDVHGPVVMIIVIRQHTYEKLHYKSLKTEQLKETHHGQNLFQLLKHVLSSF